MRFLLTRRLSGPLGPRWFQERVWAALMQTSVPRPMAWWVFCLIGVLMVGVMIPLRWWLGDDLSPQNIAAWMCIFVVLVPMIGVLLAMQCVTGMHLLSVGPEVYTQAAEQVLADLTGHERLVLQAAIQAVHA